MQGDEANVGMAARARVPLDHVERHRLPAALLAALLAGCDCVVAPGSLSDSGMRFWPHKCGVWCRIPQCGVTRLMSCSGCCSGCCARCGCRPHDATLMPEPEFLILSLVHRKLDAAQPAVASATHCVLADRQQRLILP